MCNCQTKLHFSFIQKFLHVGFCFGPSANICLFTSFAILHNFRTIADFYRTICLSKPTQFSFSSRTLSEGLMLVLIVTQSTKK